MSNSNDDKHKDETVEMESVDAEPPAEWYVRLRLGKPACSSRESRQRLAVPFLAPLLVPLTLTLAPRCAPLLSLPASLPSQEEVRRVQRRSGPQPRRQVDPDQAVQLQTSAHASLSLRVVLFLLRILHLVCHHSVVVGDSYLPPFDPPTNLDVVDCRCRWYYLHAFCLGTAL